MSLVGCYAVINFRRVSRCIHTCDALLSEKPKNLKGKKLSSQLWITRQIRDPYVEKARQEKYRCRSAFKLLEMNERFNILSPGSVVVDCGAAPGSWTQVAVKLTNAAGDRTGKPIGSVFAMDRLMMFPIEGATVLGNMDFTKAESQDKLRSLLKGNAVDVVLSDMAPNASGVREMDHENIIRLVYSAFKFALGVTKPGGSFLAKVWDGGKSGQLEQDLKKFFESVKSTRPDATRDDSAEKFFLAKGFKGVKAAGTGTT